MAGLKIRAGYGKIWSVGSDGGGRKFCLPMTPNTPYRLILCHRDHRITGRVALDAAYPLARDHLAFRNQTLEGLKPHAVKEVWLFASSQPNVFVDISNGFNLKVEARLAHESQTVDPEALRKGWRERAARIGETVGLSMSESFTVLTLD